MKLNKSENKLFMYILINAETNILIRGKLTILDKKALKLIKELKSSL